VSPGADDRIADRIDAAATGPAIAAALTALRRDERDVLLLVALADLGYDEVSHEIGIA
jgi:RNA polymerase sigma-70 factor (ECF subfamily)